MGRFIFRVPLLVIALASFSAIGGVARACDLCRATGLTMAHADESVSIDVPPPQPQAFSTQGGMWPQPGGSSSPVTITYSYNNLLDGGLKQRNGQPLPVSIIRASVEEAFRLWASVAPLHFVEVPDQGLNPPPRGGYPNGQFGQIRFHHVRINGPDIPGQQPIAKAQAYFPGVGGNLGGDVFFDHDDPWEESGTLSTPDVLGATIHEVGHSLGLGHSTLPQANMYWIFTRYQGPGTGAALHADDIAGIQQVYGPGQGSVTPLSVVVPEPAAWVLLTFALAGLLRMAIVKKFRANNQGSLSL